MRIDLKTLSRLRGLIANVALPPAGLDELARSVPALLAEREEMLALLRAVDEWPQCPWCGYIRKHKHHAEDFERAKSIAEFFRLAATDEMIPGGHDDSCAVAAFLK